VETQKRRTSRFNKDANPVPMLDRLPPQAAEAEMAVLGSMLLEKEARDRAFEILEENNFYSNQNRVVFGVLKDLEARGRAVDLVTITDELRTRGQLELAGGEVYLSDLLNRVGSAAHVVHYAEIVREKYILRELIRASTEIIETCHSGESEAEQISDMAQDKMFAVCQKQALSGFVGAKKLAGEVMEMLEHAHKDHNNVTGVPTGFSKFDDMTGGLQRSDLIILAARPSQGKTAMALNIIENAAVNHQRCTAMFSLEMGRHSLIQRLVGSISGVNLQEIRRGTFQRANWQVLVDSMSKLMNTPLWIDDTPGLTITDIRMRARRLDSELRREGKRLELVVIDYLQLITAPSKRTENRQQEVSEISRKLKEMARSLNVPVMALSQLNRRAEDKNRDGNRPQLSDLRESGSIEQDADVVALIHREDYYRRDDPEVKGKALLILAKQRNGPTGDIELFFQHQYTRFVNPQPTSTEFAPEAQMGIS